MADSPVRLAVFDDGPAILDLLRMKHAEDGIGAFDPAKVTRSVERGVLRYRAMIGVIRGRDRLEASIGLFLGSPWDSSDEHLSDRWMFVHPEHRRSAHAKNLLIFAKWAATELDCPLVISALVNDTTEAKVKLIERQVPKAGEVFVFRPPVAKESALA